MTEVIRNFGGHAGNYVSDVLDKVLLKPTHDFVPITHEEVIIDTSKALCQPEELGLASENCGWQRTVIARLAVPDDDGYRKHMVVLKEVNTDGDTAFTLRGLKMGYLSGAPIPSSQAIIPLPADGKDTVVGRNAKGARAVAADQLWPNHKLNTKVSRGQLSLRIDDASMLHVTDTSTNGSWVAADGEQYIQPPRYLKEFNRLTGKKYSNEYTYAALRVADMRHLLDVDGRFAGREVVTSKTELGGDSRHTVDIRNWLTGTPAVIVDPSDPNIDATDRKLYRNHFEGAVHRVDQAEMQKGAQASRTEIGWAINDAVRDSIQYSREWVEQHNESFADKPPEARIENLSVILREGKGACEHMMLLTAWTAGEFRKLGFLDAPTVPLIGMHEDDGGHAAAMIMGEDADGSDSIVIDPAASPRGYVGPPLASHWDYRTPEQKQAAMGQANLLERQIGVLPRFADFLHKHAYKGILS